MGLVLSALKCFTPLNGAGPSRMPIPAISPGNRPQGHDIPCTNAPLLQFRPSTPLRNELIERALPIFGCNGVRS
jgi:hypothetical protein